MKSFCVTNNYDFNEIYSSNFQQRQVGLHLMILINVMMCPKFKSESRGNRKNTEDVKFIHNYLNVFISFLSLSIFSSSKANSEIFRNI